MTATTDSTESKEYDKYCHEPLYAGNLSMKSNGMNGNPYYHRWILFVSASNKEIISPKTIKSVEYKFRNGSHIISEAPYFLESGSMGIFQFFIIITFKNNCMRSMIEIPYILSLNSPTTIIDITQQSREYIDTLFDYTKFKEFKYEKKDNKINDTSFVQHIGMTLKRNLKRVPSPLRFKGFSMNLLQFKAMLNSVITTTDSLNKLNIPSIIYDVIGFFVVFHPFYPINDLLPNQRCVINECNDCDINISSPKSKNLLIKSCNNLSITFESILSQCELHECHNITIQCNKILYSYRLDGCSNMNIIFNDNHQRVTFLCFESSNIVLNVNNIKYFKSNIDIHDDDDDEKVDQYLYFDKNKYPETMKYNVSNNEDRLNVRWRSIDDEPQFSSREFDPIQTIGSNRF